MSERMKRIVVLGSTGSVGINTLEVVARYPRKFRVIGLTAYGNLSLLEKQVRRFSPSTVAVKPEGIETFRRKFKRRGLKVVSSEHDLSQIVTLKEVDIVVIAMSGSAALEPFLAAVRCGKTVAPANKEALVIAGDILIRQARLNAARIIPVDSEQSAIFQCLEGHDRRDLKQVYLTASGGPLHRVPRSRFDTLTVEDILNHPRWKMGRKITVDSATLLNKGFEVIEALRLFDLKVDQVHVVIHPEAIIHSMVCFRDGSILAQLGIPDMTLPIQYALTYPRRLGAGVRDVDFFQLHRMHFLKPDLKKFPCLALAIDVARKGGTFPSVLNAADEEAVAAFLNGEILFSHIYEIIEKVVHRHRNRSASGLKDILAAETWARNEAGCLISRKQKKSVL